MNPDYDKDFHHMVHPLAVDPELWGESGRGCPCCCPQCYNPHASPKCVCPECIERDHPDF